MCVCVCEYARTCMRGASECMRVGGWVGLVYDGGWVGGVSV